MFAAQATWTIHTEVFEGPLDLLLYLVRRDSIDLKNIQIAQIADSYLEYLDRMRELRLNVASEYLVMAATLVHMKSLRLLPRLPTLIEEEDEPDPAAALARRLLEYQRYKEAAMDLDARPMKGRDVFVRSGASVGEEEREVDAGVNAFGLLELYYELFKRHQAGPPVHHIGHTGPNMEACCRGVLAYVGEQGVSKELGVYLRQIQHIEERIVSFIAVLEMVRLRWMDIEQKEHLGQVLVRRRPEQPVDLQLLTGRLEAVEPTGGARVE